MRWAISSELLLWFLEWRGPTVFICDSRTHLLPRQATLALPLPQPERLNAPWGPHAKSDSLQLACNVWWLTVAQWTAMWNKVSLILMLASPSTCSLLHHDHIYNYQGLHDIILPNCLNHHIDLHHQHRHSSFIIHRSSFIIHFSLFMFHHHCIHSLLFFSTITIVISIINNIFKFSFAHVIPCFRNLRPQTATPNLKSQNSAHTCWYPVPPHVPSPLSSFAVPVSPFFLPPSSPFPRSFC